jgi:hypothetical protein
MQPPFGKNVKGPPAEAEGPFVLGAQYPATVAPRRAW